MTKKMPEQEKSETPEEEKSETPEEEKPEEKPVQKKPVKKKQALLGKRMNAFRMNPDDLVVIGIDTDHKSRSEHPLWDKRIELPINEGLVKGLMRYGNIHPVTVRKNGSIPEIVDGRQRVRCAREANKRLVEAGKEPLLVKVIAQRGEDLTMFGIMVSANEIRQANSPMTKARLLETMLAMGASDAESAIAFGVTTTAIRQWKSLLDLAPEIATAVDTGQLSASAAAEFAPLEREEQIKQFDEAKEKAAAMGGKITTQNTRQRRQRATKDPAATPFTAPRKPVVRQVIELASADDKIGLSDDALGVLKWTQGLVDAKDVPGLEEALQTMEEAKQKAKEKQFQPSLPQQAMLVKIKDTAQLVSQLNGKSLKVLVARGLVETKEGKDGLQYAYPMIAPAPEATGEVSSEASES
jgi:ParB family transcriptional regulator, chromosome partitioning protein